VNLGRTGTVFASHIAGMLAAVITVPYLARVLRPDGWGQVLLAQALAAYLTLLVEYAFDLSVTRRVAALRDRREHASELRQFVSETTSARLLLAGAAVLLWTITLAIVPALRHDWRLAVSALLLSLARGFTPLWFFLGTERVTGAFVIDTAGKLLGAALIFVLVTDASHAWRALAVPAAVSSLVTVVLTYRMYRHAGASRLSMRGGTAVLRAGMLLIGARACGALYMQLNAVLVSVIAPSAAIAMFAGAERVVRAGVSLLEPLTRSQLARMSRLQVTNESTAYQSSMRLILLLGALGSATAVLSVAVAPMVVRTLLGDGYEAAVPVFRLLSVLFPVIAIGTGIGILAAVPRHRDRVMLLATASGGATNLVLAVPLTRRYGATGMAMSVVTAEVIVVLVLMLWFLREGRRT
jgi:PST family polysaccharide transporter